MVQILAYIYIYTIHGIVSGKGWYHGGSWPVNLGEGGR